MRGARHEHRHRLQIAAGQGAYGDGRRGDGRGAGKLRPARQLEDPLPRHDARRQVSESVAHGRAARKGVPGSGARARGVGRRLRSDPRRIDQSAKFRGASLPAAGPRRRPHRARDHPNASGSLRPSGDAGLHGVYGDRADARWRADRGAARLFPRDRPVRPVPGADGHPGDRGWRPRLAGHLQFMGVHGRRPGDGVRGRGGVDGSRVHPVPPDRDGLAAFGAGHSGDRGSAWRRRRPAQQQGRAVHVPLHTGSVRVRNRRLRGRGGALAQGRQKSPASAGASDPRRRGARDHE